MYFYSIEGENHIRAIIHAIEIILTSQLYFQNDINYDSNLLGHYSGTKYDFLNKFLYIIYQNAQKKLKNPNYIRLIFRIFKYVYFLFKYVKEEDAGNEEFDTGRIRTRRAIKEEKEKREKKEKEKKEKESQERSQLQQEEGKAENEIKEEKPKKTIEITLNLIRTISNKANSFLDKNDIDQAVFEYYKNNDEFGKMFALMFVLDEIGLLSQFSKYFADRMDEFKEKKFIFDINGTTHDYSTEESKGRLREYVSKSETKYYALIEGAYNYCLNLKSIKVDDKRDNAKIIEDYDNEDTEQEGEGDDDEEQKSKSSIDMDNNKEEEKEEEKEKEEKVEKKNKKYSEENSDEDESKEKKKKKESDDEEEYDEENDDDNDDDEEEDKKGKKKNKNQKKKKAEEMKPKQKKSQTYKNKKK